MSQVDSDKGTADIKASFLVRRFNQSGGKYMLNVDFTKIMGPGAINSSITVVTVQCKLYYKFMPTLF